jgi:hypothetical protein
LSDVDGRSNLGEERSGSEEKSSVGAHC